MIDKNKVEKLLAFINNTKESVNIEIDTNGNITEYKIAVKEEKVKL